jgi:FRG domain-containing protein
LIDIGSPDVQRDIDVVDTTRIGKVWAPSSLAEFSALVQWEFLGPGDLSGWRGQAREDWPLHSGAFRRLMAPARSWLLDNDAVTENVMCNYETRLLNVARLAGHGNVGRDLSDLELLAKLQHHGAATRLVDFTSNALIALWFACRAYPDDWGAVFGVKLDNVQRVADEQTLRKSLSDLLTDAGGRMMVWRPSSLSPRIPAQAGFFLWSKVRSNCGWSSLGESGVSALAPSNTSQLDEQFAAIAVSPDLKRYMATRWETILGLSEQKLFPDFDGFATANSATQDLPYTYWED